MRDGWLSKLSEDGLNDDVKMPLVQDAESQVYLRNIQTRTALLYILKHPVT